MSEAQKQTRGMSTTVSKTETYWRLKSDGFVSIKEEFPGVPSDWSPADNAEDASTLCNSNGVFLSEIDPAAWILSTGDPLVSLDAKTLDQYVQRLLDESYAGAGEPDEKVGLLLGEFLNGEGRAGLNGLSLGGGGLGL